MKRTRTPAKRPAGPSVLQTFDVLHSGETWRAWRAFVKAVHGHKLTEAELALFRKHTGLERPRAGGYPEAVAVVGVQSGKTSVAAALANHAALTGERGTHALMVAQDHRGAMRALLRYAREPFEAIPAFAGEVARQTADTIELKNGVALSAYPCRPPALRGLRACVVVCDELAFFTTTDGRPTDQEMLRVARGRVATTGGSVIVLSSPYAQAGALYELHQKHYGQDSDVLVWQASAPDMNPTLPSDYLTRMEQDDPEAYRSEVLGQFRAGTSTLFDPEAVGECVEAGVRERPPVDGIHYHGFVDVSGGRRDRFALAVAHTEGERAVLDALYSWTPPFNPAGVIAEACDHLKRYGCPYVTGDRYSAEFAAEQFRSNGIDYEAASLDRSSIYLEALPLINAEQVVLLYNETLLREMRMLERRRGPSGRDKVDHPRGQHDDLANAALGAAVMLNRGAQPYTIDDYELVSVSAGAVQPGDGPWHSSDSIGGALDDLRDD